MKWQGVVLQHDETDCGAACIATISRHYKKTLSIARIRKLAGTDVFGTSGAGLVKGAKELGFSCRGIISKKKELTNDIHFPIIAHIKQERTEHYVVIYKLKNGKVKIADPAEGLKTISFNEFRKNWSGIFFLISPNEEFKDTKENKGLFSRFFYILKPHKKIIAEVVLASIVLCLLGIISAFYFRFLIDEVLYSEMESALTVFSIGYLIALSFQEILSFCRSQLIMYMSNKIDASLLFDYFKHLLRLPLNFFSSRKTGEILARIGDTIVVRNAISGTTLTLLIDTVMLIFGFFVLFSMGSKLIFISIIPVVFSTVLACICRKPFKKMIREKAVIDADKQSLFAESINGIATIKALVTEEVTTENAETKIINSINKGIKLGTLGQTQNTLQTFISKAGNLAVYWIGSIYILKGEMSLGQLISFVTLLGYFTGPFARLISLQQSLQEAFVASDRLSEILDLSEENKNDSSLIKLENLNYDIKFENIFFSYGTRGYTLQNINVNIKQGEKIAFVGLSGSGKSTLVKLLMKFYKQESGNIFIGDYTTDEIETESFRKRIGYVPQEVLLFSGTIMENLLWGLDDVSVVEAISAAKAAQADTFIRKLPDRYNTFVGERGATLSGGERQRIALARILLRKPDILILDEATAALDSISENEIMNTIYSVCNKMTTIIIAHRLSTIKNCDSIYVMKNGTIIENGTFKTLMKKQNEFYNLWSAQNQEKKSYIKKITCDEIIPTDLKITNKIINEVFK